MRAHPNYLSHGERLDQVELEIGHELAILHGYLHSLGVTILHDAHELTVAEATQRGVAWLVAAAEHGSNLVVTRRDRPVAAVVGVNRLAELEEAAADLRDLTLVLTRAATDTGRRTPLDDVLDACGHTRDSPAALADGE